MFLPIDYQNFFHHGEQLLMEVLRQTVNLAYEEHKYAECRYEKCFEANQLRKI